MGCHALLQGIFPIQGLSPRLLGLLCWQVDYLPPIHEVIEGQNDPDCTSHGVPFLNRAVPFPLSTFSQQLTCSLNPTVPETSSGSVKRPVLILWKALSSAHRNWRTEQSRCCHNTTGVTPRVMDLSTKIKRKMYQRRKFVGTTSTPVFLPGESHGQRRLEGYGPWGSRELEMTEATWDACTQPHEYTCTRHRRGSVSQSVQSLGHVRLFETSWAAARQASLSITNSQSLLKFMSIMSVRGYTALFRPQITCRHSSPLSELNL